MLFFVEVGGITSCGSGDFLLCVAPKSRSAKSLVEHPNDFFSSTMGSCGHRQLQLQLLLLSVLPSIMNQTCDAMQWTSQEQEEMTST